MRYYSDSPIGTSRALTPEGFLICADVPIARTGVQTYNADEIEEVPANADGTVDMERPAGEVFAPAAIASFEGKPVTNDHPDGEMVNSRNWRDYQVGHVQNVRQGSGAQNDLLLGDLFIVDADAIQAILDGKVEVSCGYDHDVKVVGRGQGRQVKIVGNHVALVDAGRCGPRCAIGDSRMAVTDKTLAGWLRRAFKAKDAKELEKIETDAAKALDPEDCEDEEREGGKSKDTAVHIHLGGAAAVARDAREGKEDEEEEPNMSSKDAKRLDKVEATLGKILDLLKPASTDRHPRDRARGRGDRRRGDEMEFGEGMEDEQDPLMMDAEEEPDAEDAEREREEDEEREEREGKEDRRRRDDFPGAPSNKTGRKILGELGYTDPLGDRARRDGRGRSTDHVRVTDSSGLADTFANVLADAEIILPGVRLMTFDAKSPRKMTIDRMCAYRRRVLSSAMARDDVAAMLTDLNGGEAPNMRTASCDSVKVLFSSAAEMRRSSGGARAASTVITARGAGGGRSSASDANLSMVERMQKANRAKYPD